MKLVGSLKTKGWVCLERFLD